MENINPIVREHILSAINTFITTVIVVAGATLSAGDVEWTGAFWSGVALTAVRAAVKEVFARSLPVKLGGRG